jgi:3-hydroxyisobutyrate dehydrogenase
MSNITVLGLGAMGSRMAANLLKAGHRVTVWNRTEDKAAPLIKAGAVFAATPRRAVADAAFVIAMVRDDDASRDVWLNPTTGALGGMRHGAVAIESSTLSLWWTRELGAQAAAAGIGFLDAPVAGSRPQAEAGQLIYFVGGERRHADLAEPVLLAMGGAVHFAGALGAGTTIKLAINALFGIQVAAVAELIRVITDAGVDAATALEIIGVTPVCSPATKGAAASMLAGNFAPMFPVELVEKDFGYALAIAGGPEDAPVTTAVHGIFKEAIRRGFGADNLTGIVRLYLDPA